MPQITKVESITPERARDLLSRNFDKNRRKRQSAIESLAAAIQSGQWRLTHQGIAIGTDGQLYDGQHRLEAIVAAGRSVQMNVTTGVDPEAYQVMDTNIPRILSDRLHIYSDAEMNRVGVAIITAQLRSTGKLPFNKPTVDQVDNFYLAHSAAVDMVVGEFAHQPKRNRLSLASVGAAFVAYAHVEADRCAAFLSRYFSGLNLTETDAAYLLREALLAERLSDKSEAYWKATAAMTADRERRKISVLVAASKDLLGNVNKRVAAERLVRGKKGAATRAREAAAV